jgi:hypothetical protein
MPYGSHGRPIRPAYRPDRQARPFYSSGRLLVGLVGSVGKSADLNRPAAKKVPLPGTRYRPSDHPSGLYAESMHAYVHRVIARFYRPLFRPFHISSNVLGSTISKATGIIRLPLII